MKIGLLDRDMYQSGPDEAFAWLRANEPVYYDETGDIWGLTMHEHIVWAQRQPTLFSNAAGSRPNGIPQASLIDADDPSHQQARRVVAKGFMPRQMAAYEHHVVDVTRQLIDRVSESGQADVVTDFAKPLPMTLIGEMLGAPASDFEKLQRWSDQMITGADDPTRISDDVVNAAIEYYMYATEAVAQRKVEPRDDLLSLLVAAEVEGTIHGEQVIANALLLLVGGNETTRNVITGGVHALLRHPEQLAWLQAHPEGINNAVEECLRWVTPIVNMNRISTTDVAVGGVTIPAGKQVLMCYISANRDEKVFAQPHEFDIRRSPNQHVAFGFGPHFCLGSSLARLEIKVMLTELITRLPGLRLADPAMVPTYSHSSFVRGIQSLPVVF